MKEICFAGGSFWAVQKYFDLIDGIIYTKACYVNGNKVKVKYNDVINGSGHAEAVYIVYDPKIITLNHLLDYYYDIIDPTTLNKQGKDCGYQYRTGIYYKDKKDVEVIINSLEDLQKVYLKPIVIEVEKLFNMVIAEEYHQKFLAKNPFGYCSLPNKIFEKIKKDNNKISNHNKAIINGLIKEKPYNNKYFDNFETGIYVDIKDKKPLFSSKDKYEYDCGLPTFSKPIKEDMIVKKMSFKHFMVRAEINAKESGNFLGYAFNDGPKELGGMRYCINSASLKFIPKDKMVILGYQDYLKYLE